MPESHSYDDVIEAALSLPEDERMLVVDTLLNSVQSPQSRAWRDAWLAEVEKRKREFEANPASGIPWEEARASARRSAGLA